MGIKRALIKDLVKHGYSQESDSRIWNIGDRSFRYINQEMAKSFLKLIKDSLYQENITNIELSLLKQHIPNSLKCVEDCNFNLIDMSCDDGTKAKAVINSINKASKFRYCPVSINNYLVNLASINIKNESFPNVIDLAPRITKNFESLDQIGPALRNSKYQKNVLLFLGSLLTSFDVNDYLFKLSNSMFTGDLLIIGNSIGNLDREIELKIFNNPLFNGWLIHLMTELGFKPNEVEYGARFSTNRLELYYKILIEKNIQFEDKSIKIKNGDKIIVAFQHRLPEEQLIEFCKMYFENVEIHKDSKNVYGLIVCKK